MEFLDLTESGLSLMKIQQHLVDQRNVISTVANILAEKIPKTEENIDKTYKVTEAIAIVFDDYDKKIAGLEKTVAELQKNKVLSIPIKDKGKK